MFQCTISNDSPGQVARPAVAAATAAGGARTSSAGADGALQSSSTAAATGAGSGGTVSAGVGAEGGVPGGDVDESAARTVPGGNGRDPVDAAIAGIFGARDQTVFFCVCACPCVGLRVPPFFGFLLIDVQCAGRSLL